jgi:uncharacterized protein (DUF2252 family)
VRDIVAQIYAFNQDRIPELVAHKYQVMSENAFSFLRGTCHLFYQDLEIAGIFKEAPAVWLCGDLHLQNFGSFKGDDRLVYFDINDFDEAVLGPCTWDIARFLTSVLVGAHTLKLGDEDALQLCQDFLNTYTAELATGKDRTIHRETAKGLVDDLLIGLAKRDRKTFLDERTVLQKKHRTLKMREGKVTPASETEKATVTKLISECAAAQKDPVFFNVLDVAHRIAGTSSLGLNRYIILVEGEGSPHGNYILDLKAARSLSLTPLPPQPQWQSEAERITAIQFRFQESAPALLNPLILNNQSYVLRELQPTADRVDLAAWNGKLKRLKTVIETMAKVTAWGQLRSSGRQGSAIADELIAFAETASTWHPEILGYAQHYAIQVEQDYEDFRGAIA